MKLTNEQIKILQDWRIEDNRFYLQGQLDKQYKYINEVLNTIWLIWNKWKKAHIAEWLTQEQLQEAIEDIIETGEVETLKETIKKFQFYPTPKEVAEYLVELADIKVGDTVLEPSAWLWNIFDELPYITNQCKFIELDEVKFNILVDKYWYTKSDMWNWDFLNYNWDTFDRIIMNPPYNKRQDYKHIKKAISLLNTWWRVVWLMSRWILFREDYKDLKEDILEHWYIEEVEAGAFKESWTMIWTCIIVYNK